MTEEITVHMWAWEDECAMCKQSTVGYVAKEGSGVPYRSYNLPCGHARQHYISDLSPGEIAVALLMADP